MPTQIEAIEVGLALHCGLQKLDKFYSPQVIEAGESLGITSLVDAAKYVASISDRTFDPRNKDSILQAAFSTRQFSVLLSNVANKNLELAYHECPPAASVVMRLLNANDFKEHTGVRITGDSRFDKVGAEGQLKSSLLSEASYTYQIDTYGRIWGISRQDMANDDLDGLSELPRMLLRGSNLAIEEVAWGVVLANANNFFSTGNHNLITDALDGDGLAKAVQWMLEQVDLESKPINVIPRFVAVPPALKAMSDQLYTSRTFGIGFGNTSQSDRITTVNSFYGLYQPVAVPWLGSRGGVTGGSDTKWLLFGNPNDVAAFGLAFLHGQKFPIIETMEMQNPAVLGIQFRGYIDFGVCQIDPRGVIMSTGAGS